MTKEPAPTAEEQPWSYLKESARTSDHMHVHGATIFNLIEQLEAAIRSNREKDAQLAKTEMAWKEQNAAANAMMRRAELAEKLLAEKDAKIAELEERVTEIPLLDQLLDKRAAEIERLRAKLRAVSEAAKEELEMFAAYVVNNDGEPGDCLECYRKSEADSIFSRIGKLAE